jgi:hypothetical protein
MRPSDRERLRVARQHRLRQQNLGPIAEPEKKSMVKKLFIFWLFHKIIGGGS